MSRGPEEETGLQLPESRPESHPGRMLPALRPTVTHLSEEDGDTVSLQVYLQILRRRKWLVAAVAATILVVAALQTFTTTPLYTASAVIQIDPEDQKVLPYQNITDSASLPNSDEFVWTQTQKLQTRGLARRAVQALDLTNDPAFNRSVSEGVVIESVQFVGKLRRTVFGQEEVDPDGEAIVRVLDHLVARRLPETRLVEVTYESPDRELSANVVNTLVEQFIEQNLESKYDATIRATDYLKKELEDLRLRVEESETELIAYAREKNIVNLSDSDTINRKKLADLNDEVTQAESARIAQSARYAAARRISEGAFPDVLKNDAVRTLETRLSEVDQQLAGLSSQYGPEWPAVKELRRKLDDLTGQLSRERQQIVRSARQEYELAEDRFRQLTAALESQSAVVDTLDGNSIQYNILRRDADTNKELYDGLLQRLKEAGVAAGLRSSNIRVADPATVPRFASSPRKAEALAVAVLLGLIAGVAAAFVVEGLDNTIKTVEDLTQYLGLPTLGVVPHIESDEDETPRKGLFPVRLSADKRSRGLLTYVSASRRGGSISEAYRSLRTAILLSHSNKPPETILVSSPLPGDGKTTTAANIAIALAQTGNRTLLVDLDMRKPSLVPLFDVEDKEGMSNHLSGNADLSSKILQTRFPDLYVVPSGPPAPNPSELIGSQKMGKTLQFLNEQFKYVVFDTPPVLEVTDALVLAPLVDGVILVARAGATPRRALRQAAQLFLNVGSDLLGVLLNDVSEAGSPYGYYGYGVYGEDPPVKPAPVGQRGPVDTHSEEDQGRRAAR